MERRLTTIMAADIAGFSRLVGLDEENTLAAQRAHRTELIDPLLEKFGGRVANTAGDSFLIEFPSAVEAVRCVLALQEGMAERNAPLPEDRRITYRVGINVGDVVAEGEDLLGDGVNVAARLESLAPPGGTILSRTARDQVRDRLQLDLADLGEIPVKNIARPVRAFQLLRPGETAIRISRQTRLRQRFLLAAAFTVLMVLIAFGLYWQNWSGGVGSRDSQTAAVTPSDKPSIAVLPFTNIGGDPNQDYFADGLTDDLIIDLSKIAGLLVIARNSSFTYKGRAVDVKDVARELGVRYVLEGSVRRMQNRVRVNVQLIDGGDARNLWSVRYDRKTGDIFALQDELIKNIIAALQVKLSGEEKSQVSRLPTSNLEAYDFYLRAEQIAYRAEPESVIEALSLYERSITLDPQFADAYAGFGRVAVDALMYSISHNLPAAVARKSAYGAAGKALEIAPDLSRGYSVLALLQMLDGEHDAAGKSARKGVSFSPNNSDAHLTLALVLVYAGRQQEALDSIEKVLKLNPKPPKHVHEYHALVLYMNRDYEDSLDAISRIGEDARSEFGIEALAMSNARLGNFDAARQAVQRHLKRWPVQSLKFYEIAYSHHRRKEDLAHRLEGLKIAGYPLWPFGFKGDQSRQLRGKAIDKILFGRTWTGKLQGVGTFFQFVDLKGSVIERVATRQIVGTAVRKADLLCLEFPALVLGRPACGPVYKNITDGDASEFTYVNALGIKRFSIGK